MRNNNSGIYHKYGYFFMEAIRLMVSSVLCGRVCALNVKIKDGVVCWKAHTYHSGIKVSKSGTIPIGEVKAMQERCEYKYIRHRDVN